MEPPDGFEIRAPAAGDLDAVAAVLVADVSDDAGQVVLDADFLRGQWSRPGFDLATDAWVVVDGSGTIVGYGQVTNDGPEVVESWGMVGAAERGRGLGGALLDRIEARAAERLAGDPDGRFRHGINAGDHDAEALLRARGLRPVRYFHHMAADLDEEITAGDPPAGIDIRPVGPDDLRTVHAVLSEALADEWRLRPGAFEDWIEEETSSPNHDPTLWFLAADGARPAGALTGSVSDDRGWVDYLGVRESFRGRGIGSALLRRAFAAFAERGARRAMVSVDSENPTGATGVYARVGMRVVNGWDQWERPA
jgi:mycothiol synthase